jgi:hypothetical protein
MNQDEIDAIARALIQRWMDDELFAKGAADLFGPGARAAALMTISRVAEEMAEGEIAQLPPWAG